MSNILKMLPSPGTIKQVIFPASKMLPVWVYQPTTEKKRHQAIVAIHGISRNSLQQLEAYKSLAEKHGLWLFAPEFSKENFPSYQLLAKNSNSPRADLALNNIITTFRSIKGLPELKVHLCGYSGGAQFVHRYAYLHPYNLASLTLLSAGWYTFPDLYENYPQGLKNWPLWMSQPRLQHFLQTPMLVMVGNQDTKRDKSLRQSGLLDQYQGSNRLERANTWSKAIHDTMKHSPSSSTINIIHLDNQLHDFQKNITETDMLSDIGHFWLTS